MRLELRNRLIFGFTMGGMAIAGVVSDLMRQSHQAVLALGLVGAALGCREFAHLARCVAAEVQLAPMVTVTMALVLEAHLHGAGGDDGWFAHVGRSCSPLPLVPLLLALGLGWTVFTQIFRHATEHFFANVGS